MLKHQKVATSGRFCVAKLYRPNLFFPNYKEVCYIEWCFGIEINDL